MPLIEVEVDSTRDLIEQILNLGRVDGKVRRLWHRGHTNEQHKLLPSLLRAVDDEEAIFAMERRLITRFRQRSLPFWPTGYPQDSWEHLFAMQHFGIPTRMLDWSENLLVALYFAAMSSPSGSDEDVPAIWSLDPIEWNRNAPQFKDVGETIDVLTTDSEDLDAYEPSKRLSEDTKRRYKIPLAMFGTHNSARIVAQRGAFTVGGKSLQPMEDFAPQEAEALWKIRLNYPREQMQKDLEILGFSESMIFPDLVGLSKEIAVSEGLK